MLWCMNVGFVQQWGESQEARRPVKCIYRILHPSSHMWAKERRPDVGNDHTGPVRESSRRTFIEPYFTSVVRSCLEAGMRNWSRRRAAKCHLSTQDVNHIWASHICPCLSPMTRLRTAHGHDSSTHRIFGHCRIDKPLPRRVECRRGRPTVGRDWPGTELGEADASYRVR